MQKKLIYSGIAAIVLFTGCASNGMAVNTMGGNRVDRAFVEGRITKQQKVIIADTEVAALTGAGVGAAGGAVVGGIANGGKGAMVGGLLGALGGGVAGAFVGKEIEAYSTTIKGDDKQVYNGYVTQKLNDGQCVEFTIVDEKLKNVNVINCKTKNIQGLVTSVQKEGDFFAYNIKNNLEQTTVFFDKGYEFQNCNVNVVAYANTMEVIKMDQGQCIKPQKEKVATSSPVKKQEPKVTAEPKISPKIVVEKPAAVTHIEEPKIVEVPRQEEAKPVAKKSKYEF